LQRSFELLFLKAVRLYTFKTPIAKGKYRAFLLARRICRNVPDGLEARSKDGRRFSIDLSSNMQDTVFFLGEYEKVISKFVEEVIREHDCKVFVDAGANFGWYTTLFHKYAGENGEVHAFEPVPRTFDNLRRNFELMGSPSNVKINNAALGESEGDAMINIFPGESVGHASFSDHGRSEAISFDCKVIRLDDYLKSNNVNVVDFVKVDIEGAELSLLRGAETLFRQQTPPIFLMEMALNQTKCFDYLPDELIKFLHSHADYRFFKIDEINERLFEIDGFAPDDIGANVLCIPQKVPLGQLAGKVD
jgi:FkbM family methyltransferase